MILVSMRSPRRMDELCLLLRQEMTVRSPEILKIMWSFSLLLLLLSFFPSLFFLFSFLPTELFGSTSQVGCPLLPCVTLLLAHLDFPYPLIHIFGFSPSQVVTHVPHGSHLHPCLTCSSFNTWLHMSHSTCLHMSHSTCTKCQLVTLGVSKNMKFRLIPNLMKFDEVTRFCETIPKVKSVSSSEI